MSYGEASTSTFGAAVSFDKGVSYKASGTVSTDDDWGQDFVADTRMRSFQTEVIYKYRICKITYGNSGEAWREGIEVERGWMPVDQAGGTHETFLDKAPSHFKKCAMVARGTWWRGKVKGAKYESSASVKFKGVVGMDLFGSRGYSKSSRLSYQNKKRKTKLCGNQNSYPKHASKIRERKA